MFSTIGPRVNIYNPGLVKIGNGVIISQDTTICSASHDYEVDEFYLLKHEVNINDKVWICAEAFIGPKSLIGIGAVVAARCVLMGSVAQWTVVAGNPARAIKKRPFTNYIHDDLNHDS
jgi:putative colanic acid biosynthesis acetyltransferase WcaF